MEQKMFPKFSMVFLHGMLKHICYKCNRSKLMNLDFKGSGITAPN